MLQEAPIKRASDSESASCSILFCDVCRHSSETLHGQERVALGMSDSPDSSDSSDNDISTENPPIRCCTCSHTGVVCEFPRNIFGSDSRPLVPWHRHSQPLVPWHHALLSLRLGRHADDNVDVSELMDYSSIKQAIEAILFLVEKEQQWQQQQ